MKRRGVGVVGVLVAVTVTVVANVGAAPASSTRVVDRTYSCKVRPARYIDLETSVTLPPENGQPRPGQVRVTTVKKGIQRNGMTFYVPQVFFEEKKDSFDVDVHLKLTMQTGKPEKALLAVHNDNEKSKPIVFYRWSPSKIVGYLGNSCVETS